LVGGLKLGIWDEDGTDTLAGTGRFHDITTGTTGDMKESGTAGEVNLRGESMKSLIGHFHGKTAAKVGLFGVAYLSAADVTAVLAGTKQPQRYSGESAIGDVEVSGVRIAQDLEGSALIDWGEKAAGLNASTAAVLLTSFPAPFTSIPSSFTPFPILPAISPMPPTTCTVFTFVLAIFNPLISALFILPNIPMLVAVALSA
jgi:hypothetical protein